jgi:hypothetical protein
MRLWLGALALGLSFFLLLQEGQAEEQPTSMTPLVVVSAKQEVQVFGVIYPARFNAAQGDEAHYHLLTWQGGTSVNALIETPVDDLAFHAALVSLGAQPGDNLTMASWNKRHDLQNDAPREKVAGSSLDVHISWEGNPVGIPIDRIFYQSPAPNPQPPVVWRFGGNRARWFNLVPLAPRPGCLACLYSCPSGKVSNGALSIHDYVTAPSRFAAQSDILPPDGTPVIVTFRLRK